MFHHQNLGGNRAALVILCLVGVRMAINLVQDVVCRSIIYLSAVNVKEFEATVRRNLVDTSKSDLTPPLLGAIGKQVSIQ